MIREYKTIREISGPLMVVDHVQGVTYDELAEIVLSDGSTRRCKVLEVNGDRAVVQLFEASAGINLADSRIRFLGHPLQLAVSRDMLGRVFNGMGQPIDGGPEIIADEHRDINGLAMNPAAASTTRWKANRISGSVPRTPFPRSMTTPSRTSSRRCTMPSTGKSSRPQASPISTA